MIVNKEAYAHSRIILKDPMAEIEAFKQRVSTPDGFDKYATKRQWEYLAGRIAAHEALSEYGVHDFFPVKKESGALSGLMVI